MHAAGIFDRPTIDELRVQHAGARLARKFPEWELITAPLPAVITEALNVTEWHAIERLAGADWLRWFFDGWDEVRNAQRPS